MAAPPYLQLIAERSQEPPTGEAQRLGAVFDALRSRLLDLSNRNPMLNARVSPGSRGRRMLQIVDVGLDDVLAALRGDAPRALQIVALPDPGDVPPDELTEAFVAALDYARLTDDTYLGAIETTDQATDDGAALAEAEEVLRLKLRAELGLAERPHRHAIDRAAHAQSLGINPDPALGFRAATTPERSIRLQTLRFEDDLSDVIDRIADSARLAQQETGLSPLFLAFGFLERPDGMTSGKTVRAPLLLLPIRIVTRKVDGHEIVEVAADAGLETNLSLRQLIERDFRRALPDFDAPATDSGEDAGFATIAGYFEGVRRAIDGLAGWTIRPWMVLGTFAPGRFQLYHDLAEQHWPEPPALHPLVRAILAGTDRPGLATDVAAAPEDELDSPETDRQVPHLIFDADSSQHQAIVDVARGSSLVIEGPPGTGKSQTIANIIAHAIATGKKVLFLSEKQAALDVVRRRLEAVGLAPFCLELHSETAVPRMVVEALKARADLGWGKPRSTGRGLDPALVEARQSIRRYLDALHELQSDGETPFRLMWQAIRGQRGQEDIVNALIRVVPVADWLDDPTELQAVRDVIEVYALAAAEFEARHGRLGASPWSRTGLNDIPAYDFLRLRAALTLWREPMLAAVSLMREGADFGLTTLADLTGIIAIDAALGTVSGADYLADLAGSDVSTAAPMLQLRVMIDDLEARLAATPDLVLSPRAATARAAELVQSRFGDALTSSVPLDLQRMIRARVDETHDLIAGVEGLMPVLGVLGLDRARPGDGFGDIALLCRALGSMQAGRRAELLGYRNISEADLQRASTRQADLIGALADWRRHFPGLEPERLPRADDIRAAAAWLRRGGLARALTGLTTEAKSARDLVRALMDTNAVPDPLLMDQLADFVAYCEAFARDAGFLRAFGGEWLGIATPIEAMRRSIDVRRAFSQAIAQATGVRELTDQLWTLADDGFEVLVGATAAADRFLALPAEVRGRLKGVALGSAIPQLEAELRAAAALADLAGDPMLLSLERPLGVIADYHLSRERLSELKRSLSGLPEVSDAINRVAATDPRGGLAAVTWLSEVERTALPEEARRALTGARATETRARLARVAAEARLMLARLAEIAASTEAEFGTLNLSSGEPAALLAQIDALIAAHGQLGDFLVLRRLKLELATDGLGTFLDTAERLMAPMATLPALFETLASHGRADLVRRSRALGEATGIELDVRRKIFADRDRARLAADRVAIRSLLTEIPELKPIPGNNIGPKSSWTELALLTNEFGKSGRFLPIRTLLARAGRSVQALTPCIMASPLSLAKFMTPGKLAFDLLVIDEASQMRPEDALGGLLRAAQVVVVGDPKQLPPTDFFRRAEPERGVASDDDIDADSILEVASRCFSTVRRLKWHYRSRCESLIAFSNREFYRDSLITFPSSRPEAFSIDLVRVDGVYRNRRNPAEAARIAEEAVHFMRQFAETPQPPTLGIATVNMEQRDLIREELRRISAGDDLVETYRSRVAARGEPVFVKNLETVQGDERDYILVSLNHGKAPGALAVAQTFGAIGGRNGGRRLNVLISRARLKVALFASFGSEDVQPGDTSPAGAHVLKRYLAYVEARGRLEARSIRDEPDSDFEQEVAERLAAAGFEVEMQVGVSHYRIDLGVRHPDRKGSFLAGIECDGARYHASKAARDRDRLREDILRGLGWELLRVWSTDWFADPDEETRRLVRRLDLLRMVPDRSGPLYQFGFATERAVRSAPANGDAPVQLTFDLTVPAPAVQPAPDPAVAGALQVEAPAGSGPDAATSAEPALFDGFEEREAVYDAGTGAGRQIGEASGWTVESLADALAALRDDDLLRGGPEADPQRSILRPRLIETFVNEHVVEAGDWTKKVPRYLRLGTNAAELKFLDRICEVVARLG